VISGFLFLSRPECGKDKPGDGSDKEDKLIVLLRKFPDEIENR